MRGVRGKARFVKARDCRWPVFAAITGILYILWFLIPAIAAADGMAFSFRYGPATSLEQLGVDEQRAIIAHKDGKQRMFIAINLQDPPSAEDPSRGAVWIFPVPGTPDRADVDVTSFIPELRGDDVGEAFVTAMRNAQWLSMATQPHFFPYTSGPMIAGRRLGAMTKGLAEGTPGVTTHKEIAKWGIHAEMITADSADRLAGYLHRKKVGSGEELSKLFAPYLSDKYVLVVAWISSYDEFVSRFPQYKSSRGAKRPALYVEFPTDRPFYPMRPTSGYGKKRMTVSLYLVGWLNLDMSSWTPSEKGAMRPNIRYYSAGREAFDEHYGTFFYSREKDAATSDKDRPNAGLRGIREKFLSAVPAGDVPFTRVIMRSEAENFTQDFRFSSNSRMEVIQFLGSSPWMLLFVVIFLLVTLSYFGGGISGMLVYGGWKPWARIGLWNCLTIVALAIAAWLKRRGSTHESERTIASGRWEAFVLGILMCAPLFMLIGIVYFYSQSWERSSVLSALFWGLIVLEILIASWIVTKSIPDPPLEKELNPDGKRVLISTATRESLMRIFLLCAPAVVLAPLIFLEAFPLLQVGTLRLDVGEPLWLNAIVLGAILVLIAVIVSVLLSVLISLVLIMVSWIVRKAASVRPVRQDEDVQGEESGLSAHKSEAIVLGALACIPEAFLASVLFLAFHWTFASTFLVSACGLIVIALLVATWAVWKMASAPISMGDQLSPAWPVAFSALPLLLPVLWVVIVFNTNFVSRLYAASYYSVFYFRSYEELPLLIFFVALTIIGLVVIAGFLNRKQLWPRVHSMSYEKALSTIFLIMGVLLYLVVVAGVVRLFSRGLAIDWSAVGYGLATLSLLLGTWLVKGLLSGWPTKALRFSVLFSSVFALLNFVVFSALRSLLS